MVSRLPRRRWKRSCSRSDRSRSASAGKRLVMSAVNDRSRTHILEACLGVVPNKCLSQAWSYMELLMLGAEQQISFGVMVAAQATSVSCASSHGDEFN